MERDLTERHGQIVGQFLKQVNGHAGQIDLIGFHGQTIWHHPEQRQTIQLGDGARLAQLTQIPVINDFRRNDVEAGGHGAPLVPLYHRALAAKLPKPVAILNIGGVSNITWIGGDADAEIMAFDTGPGNALIDDWILQHTGDAYDEYGLIAAQGQVDGDIVERVLAQDFFQRPPPKSLDRDAFRQSVLDLLGPATSTADGAATLTVITARAVVAALRFLPSRPQHLYVTGGGRLNNTLMRSIRDLTGLPVSPVDDLGWSGDGLEAEAFAYLAVRSQLGLPLSVPGTTGVPVAMTGGRLHRP